MRIFFCGFGLYVFSFFLQVLIFRLRTPKNQIGAILLLYPSVLFLFLGLNFVAIPGLGSLVPLSGIECFYLALVFLAVLPNYAILYGLIEAESPSSLMVLLLESSGDQGLERTAFNNLLTNELFLWHRIAALEEGGYIQNIDSRYFITPKGVSYMNFWLIPRRLMGRTTYGG